MTDDFIIDLLDNEVTRQALIAESMDWMAEANDRSATMLAWMMLFSNLDDKQKETYAMLVAYGLLGEDHDQAALPDR